MRGLIADILPFSVSDGPGIRTSVFFKGCPLRCAWCHNPEDQLPGRQVMVRFSACLRCGACSVCPGGARGSAGEYDMTRCTGCGTCVSLCPAGACRMHGQYMDAEEVASRVLRDRPFFRARGGVTLTGGEPLSQAAFARDVAQRLHAEGVHVLVETCGFVPWEAFQAVLPFADGFLYDWKITDPQEHRRRTGQDNRLILNNLRRLDREGADIVLRCPVIPGVNDTQAHFRGIGQLTEELPRIRHVDILPYHPLGNDKRGQLGLEKDGFHAPDAADVLSWKEQLQRLCRVPVST